MSYAVASESAGRLAGAKPSFMTLGSAVSSDRAIILKKFSEIEGR